MDLIRIVSFESCPTNWIHHQEQRNVYLHRKLPVGKLMPGSVACTVPPIHPTNSLKPLTHPRLTSPQAVHLRIDLSVNGRRVFHGSPDGPRNARLKPHNRPLAFQLFSVLCLFCTLINSSTGTAGKDSQWNSESGQRLRLASPHRTPSPNFGSRAGCSGWRFVIGRVSPCSSSASKTQAMLTN